MTLPDFVIIGAMKAATTTLHEQLAHQPGLVMSDPKEPCFFSDDEVFARGTDWYRGLFAGAGPADLCGESSTHYTKRPDHPRTVERMRALLPDVRLVYVMRQPLDRLVSHYIHLWTERTVSVPVDEAVDRHPELVDYGRYAYQLEPYLDVFGPDRVLPVSFARLRRHPRASLEEVARFVGYGGEVRWRDDADVTNASLERLRTSRVRDGLRESPVFPLVRRLTPQPLVDALHRRLRMPERPVLGAEVAARLEALYDADLAVVGSWLGTDLSCARFDAATADRPAAWATI